MHQGYSLYHSKQDLHYDKGTWHAHSYSKPPARPTPHFIEDILGLKSRRADQAKEEVRDDMMVDEQMNVSCNRTSKQKTKCKSRIKCPVADNNRVPGGGKAKTPPSLKGPKKELHAKTGGGETKKKKKARTTFTGRQIWELENTFKDKKYLTAAERNDLAQLLNVTDNQVKIWFQNRRTKWKKHVSSKNEVLPKGKNNNEKTYDLKESYTSDGHADGDDGSVSADEGSDSKLESASCSGEDEID